MKLYYNADVEERNYEGRSQMSMLLKTFLEKKGFEFVKHPKDADIIHFHSSGIFESYKAAELKKRYKKPTLYSLYSVSKTEPFNHFRNHFAQRYYLRKRKTSFLLSYSAVLPMWLRAFRLNELDAVITPSYFVKNMLGKNGVLIRLGIDEKKFYPQKSRGNKEGEQQKLKVGYFGHPSAYKGVLDFAMASRELSKRYDTYIHVSDISKRIAGSFKRISPKANLVGYIEDIASAYNSMDIIVLPYRSHLAGVANPLVLLEAMSCGKAIVTTNFSYLKEIVKDSALKVNPYSPKHIIKAVDLLAQDGSLRKKLGRKARKIILEEYTQKRMFDSYLKLYGRFST